MIDKKPYVGQIVISTQGRDKGKSYIIYQIKDDNIVFLVDGKYKLLLNPKKKRLRHIRLTPFINKELANKINQNIKVNDQMVYHALHEYLKLNKEATDGK